MAANARLAKVKLKLQIVDVEWEADEREIIVLRNVTNQLRSRRAFEMDRGYLAEHPLGFIQSVSDSRQQLRALLDDLPPSSSAARLVVFSVMDWLSQIDDKWFEAVRFIAPDARTFAELDFNDMVKVMEMCWSTVETVRQNLDVTAGELEEKLKIAPPSKAKPKPRTKDT